MSDKREDILNFEYNKWVSEKGIGSIYSPNFPAAYRDAAINAMDEHGKQMSLEFLDFVIKNMQGSSIDVAGSINIKYKGEWITKEALFEKFI